MVKYLLKMSLVLLICFLTVHLTAGNDECPNDEGSSAKVMAHLALQGEKDKVRVVVPHQCKCYKIFYSMYPNAENLDFKELNGSQNEITIDDKSPNCTLSISNPEKSHAGLYKFQRDNYTIIVNGMSKHGSLQWNYHVIILGIVFCREVITYEPDKAMSAGLCEVMLIPNQTNSNIKILMEMNSIVTINNVTDDYIKHYVELNATEPLSCKVSLKLPEHFTSLSEKQETVCYIQRGPTPPPTTRTLHPTTSTLHQNLTASHPTTLGDQLGIILSPLIRILLIVGVVVLIVGGVVGVVCLRKHYKKRKQKDNKTGEESSKPLKDETPKR